jgi:hypothetical protein
MPDPKNEMPGSEEEDKQFSLPLPNPETGEVEPEVGSDEEEFFPSYLWEN